tara:strand:- start:44015 stop:44308 length:294 start_codon:yes stop_codon:yes gene_type:complete
MKPSQKKLTPEERQQLIDMSAGLEKARAEVGMEAAKPFKGMDEKGIRSLLESLRSSQADVASAEAKKLTAEQREAMQKKIEELKKAGEDALLDLPSN